MSSIVEIIAIGRGAMSCESMPWPRAASCSDGSKTRVTVAPLDRRNRERAFPCLQIGDAPTPVAPPREPAFPCLQIGDAPTPVAPPREPAFPCLQIGDAPTP